MKGEKLKIVKVFILLVLSSCLLGVVAFVRSSTIDIVDIKQFLVSNNGMMLVEIDYVSGGANISLFRRNGSTAYNLWREGKLMFQSPPIFSFLSDKGALVAFGGDQALAIYNEKGESVKKYKIEEILNKNSLKDLQNSKRAKLEHWFCRDCAAYREFYFENSYFYFSDFKNNKYIVDVSSGELRLDK